MTPAAAWTLAGGGAAILLAAIGLVLYALKWARSCSSEMRDALLRSEGATKAASALKENLNALAAEHDKLLSVLKVKEEELTRERTAKETVERQRKELIEYLAKLEDPHVVAMAINDELGRLSQMSKADPVPSSTPR